MRDETEASIARRSGDAVWMRRLPRAAVALVILALIVVAVTPALMLNRITATLDDVGATFLPALDPLRRLSFVMEGQPGLP